jgi:hypothetical protein
VAVKETVCENKLRKRALQKLEAHRSVGKTSDLASRMLRMASMLITAGLAHAANRVHETSNERWGKRRACVYVCGRAGEERERWYTHSTLRVHTDLYTCYTCTRIY